ncbi:MAG: hypothetical protein PHI98_10925 [Eubacteriales bacterium]|nr:hypothetical protein [Eubacteriales bacterium]
MQHSHQQFIPNDLQPRPRPSDREIYLRPASTAHLERSDNGITEGELRK